MEPDSTSDSREPQNAASHNSAHPMRFEGKTGEFFAIWIVNVLLSIVTVGIYSAWAKVRTTRYFYSNTYLNDSAFEYTADPVKILKGRLLAAGLFLAIQLAAYLAPVVSDIAFLLLMLAFPALLVLALRFRMHYTRWRGIRFVFAPDFTGAYVLFIPLIAYAAVVALLSLAAPSEITEENSGDPMLLWIFYGVMTAAGIVALLFPWWQNRYYRFIGNRTSFGQQSFTYTGGCGGFYLFYAFAGATVVAGIGGYAGLNYLGSDFLAPSVQKILPFVLIGTAYAAAMAYILTARNNLIYSRIQLGEVSMESRLRFPRMCYLYLTNTIAIVLSLGLAIPWAKIRMAHYRAETFTVYAPSFDDFVGAAATEQQATAEDMSEVFAWDFGL
ncbi:MAG: YjgN family protein [Pseudomonadota bacterium]